MSCSLSFNTLHRPTKFNTKRLLKPSSSIDWINLGYRQLTQDMNYLGHYRPSNMVAPSLLQVAKVNTGSHKMTKEEKSYDRYSIHSSSSSSSSSSSGNIRLYEIYNENLKSYRLQPIKENHEPPTQKKKMKKLRKMMSKLKIVAEKPFVTTRQ